MITDQPSIPQKGRNSSVGEGAATPSAPEPPRAVDDSPLKGSTISDHRPAYVKAVVNLANELSVDRGKFSKEENTEKKAARKDSTQKGPESKAGLSEVVKAFKHIREFLRAESKFTLISRFSTSFLTALRPLCGAALTSQVIDSVAKGQPPSIWVTALIALPIVVGKLQVWGAFLDQRMKEKNQLADKRLLTERVHKLTFKQAGDKVIAREVEKLRANPGKISTLIDSIFEMSSAKIAVVGALALMATVNLPCTLLVATSVVPLLYIEKKKADFAQRIQTAEAKHHQKLWPFYFDATGKETATQMKVLGKSQWAVDHITKLTTRIAKIGSIGNRHGLKASLLAEVVKDLGMGIAGGWAVYQASKGVMSWGEAVKFITAIGALQLTLAHATEIWGKVIECVPFVNKCFALDTKENEAQTKKFSPEEVKAFKEKLKNNNVSIRFKNVEYEVDGKRILSVDDLEIKAGSFVGIVGKSGAGKTTLLSLLLGVYEPTRGSIELSIGAEQYSLTDIPLEAWHSHIGYNPQGAYYGYTLTVKESIELGVREDDHNPLTLAEAMYITSASRIVAPEDAAHVAIGDSGKNGRRFSGGELQALNNTRALIGNRKMLILDEPTSALDAEGETELLRHLGELKGEKTLLIISHRFNTFQNVDRIIVLKDGKVEAVGNHEELMKDEHGIYRKLYEMQVDGLARNVEDVGVVYNTDLA